ncbi:glutamate mutase L, partial [bacterium]|nr:glutamate mutase L [bacterium]
MDILTIEIGSTITKANGFQANPKGGFDHVAQGLALTSVGQGDVGIGVLEAKTALEQNFGQSIGSPEVFINSSAAGGLRITVHGLTSNMTARAAREASLGAGAIVIKITAGLLSQTDLEEIFSVKPNMIIIAGGVDFGEQDIVLENAKKILNLQLPVPVIYSGNCALQKTLIRMFANSKSDFAVSEN